MARAAAVRRTLKRQAGPACSICSCQTDGERHALETLMMLAGKVAIITGGARGIGHSTAVKFAAEGAKVAVCDINPELMQQTLAAIRSTGGEAEGYPVDVTKKETLAAMVKAVMGKWGGIGWGVHNG